MYLAYLYEPPGFKPKKSDRKAHAEKIDKDFHLILLGGNLVTMAEMQLVKPKSLLGTQYKMATAAEMLLAKPKDLVQPEYMDVLQCAAKITESRDFSCEGFHPGYDSRASVLVQRIVKRVETINRNHPNVHIILSGCSLGGGLSMVAAAELKKRGVVVDVINARSFSSVGSVVVAKLGLDPNRIYNRPLRGFINGVLWLLGGWDIDAKRALGKLKRSLPAVNLSPTGPLKLDQLKTSSVVHITTWLEKDNVIGKGYLGEKISSNLFMHEGSWDPATIFRSYGYLSPSHATPVPIGKD